MSRSRNLIIAVVLLAGLGVGLALVVRGSAEPTDPAAPDLSVAGVNEMASLAVPADAEGFLTASLDDGSQIDVTFVLPDDAAAATFVAESGLPALEPGKRLILHSSPMWKLNPEGVDDGDYSSTGDATDRVKRVVEVVPDGDAVRVRMVLSPTS